MPVVPAGAAVVQAMHVSSFHSYVAPSCGSAQLCAWRVDLSAGQAGAAHRVSHEEVFLVLEGSPTLDLDGARHDLEPGAVVFVPAGATLRLGCPGPEGASLWVTAPVGLTATTGDGRGITPPWTL